MGDMTFVITSSAKSGVAKAKQSNSAKQRMDFTLALTLTLSPEEREQLSASLRSFEARCLIPASWSFAEKTARFTEHLASPKRGEKFSLPWGRGPG